MKISAFDLSLTGTGWAIQDGEFPLHFGTLNTRKLTGMERLRFIKVEVAKFAYMSDLVIMEGLSFGSNDPSAQERAGLAYLIRYFFWQEKQRYLLAAPSQVKKFCTGKGNAKKEMLIKEVYKRWGVEAADNNQADALVLMQIGRCLMGTLEPTTDAQRDVLKVLKKSGGAP